MDGGVYINDVDLEWRMAGVDAYIHQSIAKEKEKAWETILYLLWRLVEGSIRQNNICHH